jgi:hypothetical protein
MTPSTDAAIAVAVLEQMDSHGIYAESILDPLPAHLRAVVPTHTETEVIAQIKARGLGGSVDKTDEMLVSGYMAATALAQAILGDAPGLAFHGRGSSFRADLAALKQAANG